MRQRVGFARGIVTEPDALLMDEPFSALDVLTAENLRTELVGLWEGHEAPVKSILIVTHNIEEAVLLADQLNFGIDDLLPLVDAAVLLGLARADGPRIAITEAGREFAVADILTSKQLFARHAARSAPLVWAIVRPWPRPTTAPCARASSSTCSAAASAPPRPAASWRPRSTGAATPSCTTTTTTTTTASSPWNPAPRTTCRHLRQARSGPPGPPSAECGATLTGGRRRGCRGRRCLGWRRTG